MADEFSADLEIVDEARKPTSYLEDYMYQLGHVEEGSPGSSDAGEIGWTRIDSNFFYICFDTNMWARIAITTGY